MKKLLPGKDGGISVRNGKQSSPERAWKTACFLPLLTLLSGIPALVCYEATHELFMFFWAISLLTGVAVMAWELVILLRGGARLVRSILRQERQVTGAYWKMFLYALLGILVAFSLMLLLTGMTLGFDI